MLNTGYLISVTRFWMLCTIRFEICCYFSTRYWAELFWFENGGKFQTHGLEHKKSCYWNELTSTSNSKVHFLSKNWDFHFEKTLNIEKCRKNSSDCKADLFNPHYWRTYCILMQVHSIHNVPISSIAPTIPYTTLALIRY